MEVGREADNCGLADMGRVGVVRRPANDVKLQRWEP